MNKEQPTYAQAMAEIEAILGKLQNQQPDIDTLASDVRRATELIRMCRERLSKVEKDVSQVLREEKGE